MFELSDDIDDVARTEALNILLRDDKRLGVDLAVKNVRADLRDEFRKNSNQHLTV